jgi:sec-independent protein translocase protein TatB
MNLFGVGASEALLVLVLAMIVVGPQRFPEIARQGGRWFRLARSYTDEVMKDVRSAVTEIEHEINDETSDFASFGDLTEDLRSVREDVEAVTKDTATEAKAAVDSAEQAAAETPTVASTKSTAARESSFRPSKRSQDT